MIKDFTTYINEGLFDRNQSEFAIRKTDKGIEQVYVPKTKEELYEYIDIDIEQAKKDGTYPDVNLNNIDVSEFGDDVLKDLFSDNIYMINPDISDWDIKSIPNKFFYKNKKIKEFTISDNITSIGWCAFAWCSNLKSITIPNSVTIIDYFAFKACSELTSVTIPNSVTSIGNYAFQNCSGLTSVTIPNSVTSIGDYVFYNCSSLTSITIPNSVKSIGKYAFWSCSGLTSITIPNSVTSIGSDAFEYCRVLTSITIGNSVMSIGRYAFQYCSGLTSIVVESGNTAYDSRNNCNAIIETATNTLVVGCQSTIIPNSVNSIGESAFFCCSGLTSVTIPNSVTNIGDWAFYGCGDLKYVTISKHCNIMPDSFPRDCTIIRK